MSQYCEYGSVKQESTLTGNWMQCREILAKVTRIAAVQEMIADSNCHNISVRPKLNTVDASNNRQVSG